MKYFLVLVSVLVPSLAHAAGNHVVLIRALLSVLNYLIPILIGLAVLLFLWGILRYVFSTDESARKDAISVITHGLIVLFIMISVWGLVSLLSNTFDLYGSDLPIGPKTRGIKEFIK